MTFGYGGGAMPDGFSEAVLSCQESEDCLIPMGITSENVAADFNIPRSVQDEFAAKSFQKAAAAQKAGKFKDEIVPLKVKIVDPKTEQESEIVVDRDDGVRDGVTAESLGKLKPAFKKDGTTHAGKRSFHLLSSLRPSSSPSVRSLMLGFPHQETPRKSLTALRLSSSRAARSRRSSGCPSSASSSPRRRSAYPHA